VKALGLRDLRAKQVGSAGGKEGANLKNLAGYEWFRCQRGRPQAVGGVLWKKTQEIGAQERKKRAGLSPPKGIVDHGGGGGGGVGVACRNRGKGWLYPIREKEVSWLRESGLQTNALGGNHALLRTEKGLSGP